MTVRIETEGGEATDPVGGIAVFVVASETGVTGFKNRGYDFERRTGTLYADGVASNSTTGRNRGEEFVNPGCGTTRDVTFRIESTTGDGAIDERTELDFVSRTEK